MTKGKNSDSNTRKETSAEKTYNMMGKVKREFTSLVDQVEKRIEELEEKERHWAVLEKSMEEHAALAAEKITLDIGKFLLFSFNTI